MTSRPSTVPYTPPPMPLLDGLGWLRATSRRRWWTAFVICAALSGLWAVATPLFGSPDEPAHAIRAAAAAEGKLKGDGTHGVAGVQDGSVFYRVPSVFAHADDVGCFAFSRETTANCLSLESRDGTARVATSAGNYPPAYYVVVGLPSRVSNSTVAIYLMRLVSVLIAAALLASAITTLDRFPRPRLVALGVAVAVTPMVLFLGGTVNPSAVEISAAIAAWITVIAIASEAASSVVETRLVVRLTVALALLAQARTISPIWVLAIAASGAVLAGWSGMRVLVRRRSAQIGAAVVAVSVAAQAAWTLYANPLASSERTTTRTLSNYLIQRHAVGDGATLYRSMIGIFGWLDTPSPFGVTVLWTVVLGFVVVLGLALASRRQGFVLTGLIVLTILVPIVAELAEARSKGFFWQGRYTLPLAVGVPILAAAIAARSSARFALPSRLPIIGVSLLALAQLTGFAQALRRYSVGYDGAIMFWNHPAWSPPVSALLLTIGFAVAVVAFAIWLVGPGADAIGTEPTAATLLATEAASPTAPETGYAPVS